MSVVTPQVLLRAYAAGVFPMAESADDPSLYWVEPEERGVFPLDAIHVSKSLRQLVRAKPFEIRVDHNFVNVIAACAEVTDQRESTWINGRIRSLYSQLHKMGCAHSLESWQDGKLVGGLYGVRIGSAFFGESMFSRVSGASKVAFVHLAARLNCGGFTLLDAQFLNSHIETLGAVTIKKADYQKKLELAIEQEADFGRFTDDNNPSLVLAWALKH